MMEKFSDYLAEAQRDYLKQYLHINSAIKNIRSAIKELEKGMKTQKNPSQEWKDWIIQLQQIISADHETTGLEPYAKLLKFTAEKYK